MSDAKVTRRRISIYCGGYALLVAGVAAFVFVAMRHDPGFAGIWLILVTVPGSLLVSLVPENLLTGTAFWAALTLIGFLQAWLLRRLLIRLLCRE